MEIKFRMKNFDNDLESHVKNHVDMNRYALWIWNR